MWLQHNGRQLGAQPQDAPLKPENLVCHSASGLPDLQLEPGREQGTHSTHLCPGVNAQGLAWKV